MIKRNRYSLVHVAEDGEVTTFSVTSETDGKKVVRKKFPLTQLDAFTTRLSSEDELYGAFKFLSGKELSDGKFYIQYRQDKMDKKIRIAGPEDINLRNISNDNIGNDIVKNNKMFETYVNNLLYRFREDYSLFRFLIKSQEKYLNSYVLKQIYAYYEAFDNGDERLTSFYFRKVCEAISSYKVIRNIEDGIKKYKEKTEIRYDESPFEKGKRKKFEIEEEGQYRLF